MKFAHIPLPAFIARLCNRAVFPSKHKNAPPAASRGKFYPRPTRRPVRRGKFYRRIAQQKYKQTFDNRSRKCYNNVINKCLNMRPPFGYARRMQTRNICVRDTDMLDADTLSILTESAKYDVSCSSSGSKRANGKGGLGNASVGGICHSFTPTEDVSLF